MAVLEADKDRVGYKGNVTLRADNSYDPDGVQVRVKGRAGVSIQVNFRSRLRVSLRESLGLLRSDGPSKL